MSVSPRAVAAFTIIELMVSLSVVVILIGLALPALSKARESSRTATCAAGLRQWGMALRLYLNDHNQYLPREGSINNPDENGTWYNELPHYVNAQPYKAYYDKTDVTAEHGFPNNWIWHCPTRIANDKKNSNKNSYHYGMNAVLNGTPNFGPNYTSDQIHTDAQKIPQPSHTVFMLESRNQPAISPAYNSNPDWEQVDRQRHGGHALNVLFIDGRVSLIRDREIPTPAFIDNLWRSDNPTLIWGPFKN